MKSAVIFGASATGRRLYEIIRKKYHVAAFVDEDPDLCGQWIEEIEIFPPERIKEMEFDVIVIAVLSRYEEVKRWLMGNGVEEEKIITSYVDLPNRAREDFVCHLQQMLTGNGIDEGAIAELGVYQGEFSKVIGKYFQTNRFYLFDTFEGFPQADTEFELSGGMSPARRGYFSNTSSELVLSKIHNNDRCIVCKGYFPDTAEKIDDKFIFVNLDADLYQPTKAGLAYFYPKLMFGGVILIHDYFSSVYKGVKKAVDTFCRENNLIALPIGDTLSVALVKNEDFT